MGKGGQGTRGKTGVWSRPERLEAGARLGVGGRTGDTRCGWQAGKGPAAREDGGRGGAQARPWVSGWRSGRLVV